MKFQRLSERVDFNILHTHAVHPGEPGSAGSPLTLALHILPSNTIPPCPSQTGEGKAAKEEREVEGKYIP